MQQDQRRSCPPFHVVEANTLHGNDPPDGRVTTLSFFASHRFNRADATAATTTPAAIGRALPAILEEARAEDLV